MKHEFKTNAFYSHVIEWLQENVGNLQWSRPIIEWQGQGWYMRSSGVVTGGRYIVKIDDPKKAMLAALRWS